MKEEDRSWKVDRIGLIGIFDWVTVTVAGREGIREETRRDETLKKKTRKRRLAPPIRHP